ncbi:MAG: AAA family ATPase [Geodermatophilaceae bacterium]|nr:AAA family ATPase [Geodermatophilaceae bacterium]
MIQLPTITPAPQSTEPTAEPPVPAHRPLPASSPLPGPQAPREGPERSGPAGRVLDDEAPETRKPSRRFSLFKGRAAARALLEEQERSRLSIPIQSPRRVAVVGLKGGVGKTTLSVLLAGIYAKSRDEPVLLLDADPTFGSLLLRSGVAPTHSARDLAGRGDPGDLTVLTPYLARSASGAWVLPSGLDPGESARFDEATFVATMDVVHRHFAITVTDCGAGLSGSLMRQLLSGAHTLVFTTSPSVDGITATYAGLRWIAERGFGPLVANSFVAVAAVRRRDVPVDLAAAAKRFDGLCRGLISLPEDPHLRAGARIDQSEVTEQTRLAMLHFAAEVLEAAQRA